MERFGQLDARLFRVILVLTTSNVMVIQGMEILEQVGVQKLRFELSEVGFMQKNTNGVTSREVDV